MVAVIDDVGVQHAVRLTHGAGEQSLGERGFGARTKTALVHPQLVAVVGANGE